jgi:NAD(P)-dependent dehydrogenase (short-subunit alcohol dehydrogenase family)
MPADPLSGQTALITGAAKRIGRETALALADLGINIVLHFNRSDDESADLAAQLRQKGVQSWTIQADFRRPDEYQSLIDRTLLAAGRLDILVNNASMFPQETLSDLTWQSLSANMEVNAWVPFVLCREFAHRVGRGKIVNLLDSRLVSYDWTHVGYILSKHVLAALTRMMALEYAPDITINAVAPGLVLPPPGKDESYINERAHTVPLRRHGGPQDIAAAVAFLVRSEFLTGEVIFVDGGRHLYEYDGSNPHQGPHASVHSGSHG